MNSKQKILVEIILGVVIGVIVYSITGIQGACFPFGLPCLLITTFEFALIMYLVFWGIPSVYKKYKDWRRATNNNNITLSDAPPRGNNFYLKLCNKESHKPSISVSRIQICIKDRVYLTLEKPHPAKLISLKNNNECQEFPFIMWGKTYEYFSVADPDGEDLSEKEMFRFGEFEFDVFVLYGFTAHGNDIENHYVVSVSYNEENGIRIGKIEHVN